MRYPNFRDPGEARSFIHTIYERYAQGVDIFPKARMAVRPEDLPRKTQQIAQALVRAWEIIDVDKAFFWERAGQMADMIQESSTGGRGVLVANAGRNAVRYAEISPGEGGATVEHRIITGEELVQLRTASAFRLSDGRTVGYLDGYNIASDVPDQTVYRDRPDGGANFWHVYGADHPGLQAEAA